MAHEGRSRGRGARLSPRRRGSRRDSYSGTDVGRALRESGYDLESGGEGEVEVYYNPTRGSRVPVNPGWRFYDGDPIFRTLQRDLDVSARTLRRMLDQDH